MINKDIIHSLQYSRDSVSYTIPELVQSKDFYLLIESFCALVSESNFQYSKLLNFYFNEEGYIDCWQIPCLLLDIYEKRFNFHQQKLTDSFFTFTFYMFIIEFYNFCMQEYQPYSLKNPVVENGDAVIFQMQLCKHQTNLFFELFGKVLENLQSVNTNIKE